MHTTHRRFSLDTLVRYRYSVIGLVLILVGLLAMWINSLSDVYIPSNFTYSADVAVTANVYDPVKQRFSGSRFSVGSFSIQETGIVDGVASLQSSIDVTRVNDVPVGKLTRDYTVETKTGKYIDASAQDAGYVFAPRNLPQDQSFKYRQLLYPAVATMEYFGKETIRGVEAYRYHASYDQNDAVLVHNLTGVELPEGQELRASPRITIWVEPQTGWLLKYSEESTVSVYSVATQARLSPLYHFTAGYTDVSVQQQVQYAKNLKAQIAIGHQVIPGILVIIAFVTLLILIIRRFGSRSVSTFGMLLMVLLLTMVATMAWFVRLSATNAWIQASVVLNPLTGLCLILATLATGIVLYAGRWRWVAFGMSVFVLMTGLLQTLSNIRLISWQPDLVLFHDDLVQIGSDPLVRMSPTASFLFLILGIALVKRLFTTNELVTRFTRLAAAVVFAVALSGLVARLLGLDQLFNLSTVSTISLVEWSIFVLFGFAIFQVMDARQGRVAGVLIVSKRLLVYSAAVVPVLIIGVLAQVHHNTVERQLGTAFEARSTAISQRLQDRLTVSTNMLIGIRSLFAASNSVDQQTWHEYTSTLQVSKNYPGILSVGYVQHAAGRDSVLFVEPTNAATSKALGYDMSEDMVRSEAMSVARDEGTPTLSDVTTLSHEAAESTRGFLVFIPVYRNGAAISDTVERRAALEGYVYAAFDAETTARAMLDGYTDNIGVIVYDSIQTVSSSILYSTSSVLQDNRYAERTSIASGYRLPSRTETIYANNHPWVVYSAATSDFGSSHSLHIPGLIWVAGSGVYVLLALVFFTNQSTRLYAKRVRRSVTRRGHR